MLRPLLCLLACACAQTTPSASSTAAASRPPQGPAWSKYRGDSLDTGATTFVSNIVGSNPAIGWKFETQGSVDSSPALGADGTLYIGSDDRRLYALNSSNGYSKWSVQLAGTVRSTPALSANGSTVYVGSDQADQTVTNQTAQTTVCCTAQEGQNCVLQCPRPEQVISQINVASFGTPTGTCTSSSTQNLSPNYLVYTSTISNNPTCDAYNTEPIVADPCLSQSSCSLLASSVVFTDACPGVQKTLAISASCTYNASVSLPIVGLLTKQASPVRSQRLRYIPRLPANYFFRFRINPQPNQGPSLGGIFQFDSYDDDSQRLPAIYFCDGVGSESLRLCITYLSGLSNGNTIDPALYIRTSPLQPNQWTTVTVSVNLIDLQQIQVTLSGATRGTFVQSYPSGKTIDQLTFRRVGLYFSSPFYPAANCFVKDYTLSNNFDSYLDAYLTSPTLSPTQKRRVWRFRPPGFGGYILSSPALMSDGTIVVGSMNRRVYAITPAGSQRWMFVTDGSVQSSPAIASDNAVCIGDDAGIVYYIPSTGGKEVWRFKTGNWIFGAPAIYPLDGSVIVGSADRFLYRFRKTDGKVLWRLQTTGALLGSPAIQPSTGNIVCANDQGTVYLIGIDGIQRWQYSIKSTVSTLNLTPILSSPVISGDGTIYLGADDGVFYAFTLGGSLLWKVQTGGPLRGEAALSADGSLYIGSGDTYVYQITKAPTLGAVISFNYTGSTQSYVVPTNTFSLQISLYGAQGANPSGDSTKPGMGGMVSATVSVTPGMTLFVTVGAQPASNAQASGGYNGGGAGRCNGGGGGGLTSVYVTNATTSIGRTYLLVAGGGGGCGYYGCLGNGLGGPGGLLIGASGSVNTYVGATPGCQGTGGSQTSGGAGGIAVGVVAGAAGSFLQGGASSTSMMCSAGGGGGWYGGGGSSGGCGAGGGSSYINPAFSPMRVSSAQGVQMGHGYAVFQLPGSPTARPTFEPTVVPSALPSNEPIAAPTLMPSLEPSSIPTRLPTPVPSIFGFCERFVNVVSSGTNNAWDQSPDPALNNICRIQACGGDQVVMSTCPKWGNSKCTGDTFLRLFDSAGVEVAQNDDGPSSENCGKCAQIDWTPPLGKPHCQTYFLREGCGSTDSAGCSGTVHVSGPKLQLPMNTTFSFPPTALPTRTPTIKLGDPIPDPTRSPTPSPSPLPTSESTRASGDCPLYQAADTNSASRQVSSSCGITAAGGAMFTVSTCQSNFPGSTASCNGATALRLFTAGGREVSVTKTVNWRCGTCAEFSYTVPLGTPSQQFVVVEGCVGSSSCSGTAVVRGAGFTVQAFQPTQQPSFAPSFLPGSPTALPTVNPTSLFPTVAPTTSLLCPAYQASGMSTRSCGVTLCSGETVTGSMCGNVVGGATCTGPTTLRLLNQQGMEVVADNTGASFCPAQSGTRCAQITYTAPIDSSCQIYQFVEGCNAQGTCTGVIGVGQTTGRPLVTPQPSTVPTPAPTFARDARTPAPSIVPTPTPSVVPTVEPTFVDKTCVLYQQDRSSYNNNLVNVASCGITACEGVPFTVSLCGATFPGAKCTGNTFLRIFDSTNTQQLAESGTTGGICGQCSQVSYTPPANSGCQLFLLREGCSGAAPCTGTAVVSGAGYTVITFLPTLQPTAAPSYRAGRPTPQPSQAPTSVQICNQFNSKSNVMSCGVRTCPGQTFTVSFCNRSFPAAYCKGNVKINLLDAIGKLVATNTNSSNINTKAIAGTATCGSCSQLTYTPPTGPGTFCQLYTIQEVCQGLTPCTGQAVVTGANIQIIPFSPTQFPSSAPSYKSGDPIPQPTAVPTFVPTAAPTPGTPSLAPIVSPTQAPTSLPTQVPTAMPSPWPTSTPTFAPSSIITCQPYSTTKTNDASVNYAACGVRACGNTTFLATTCSERVKEATCDTFQGSVNTRLKILLDSTLINGAVKEVPIYDTITQLSQQNGAASCCSTVQYTTPKNAVCQTYVIAEGCSGAGPCSGTVAVAGAQIIIVKLSPSTAPTSTPTYLLSNPTPLPSATPTTPPSPAPSALSTPSPTGKSLMCKLYSTAGTVNDGVTSPVCGVQACGNQTFTVSLCAGNFPGATCSGSTFLRLFDEANSNMVAKSDTGIGNCGNCAQLTYTPPQNAKCQTYKIREGCDLDGRCTGTAVIVGGNAIKLITYAPTPEPSTAPTYTPNDPTPRPTSVPTTLPTPATSASPTSPGPTQLTPGLPSNLPTSSPTFNVLRCPLFGEGGQMTPCRFTLCGGKSVSITSCPDPAFAGSYCIGDVSFKLFTTQGAVVASNDHGPGPFCGMCPQMSFTAPGASSNCLQYTLREYCAAGAGGCSGVASLLVGAGDGISLVSGPPSAQPTIQQSQTMKPSFFPTYLPGNPTPQPTINTRPTSLPTLAPTLQQFCPPFTAINTNSALNVSRTSQCSITACGGQTLTLGCCSSDGSQGSCYGDTFMRLLEPSTLKEVGADDDSCGATGGSRIVYTIPSGQPCADYILRQGCFENTACGGSSNVIGGATIATTLPTYAPTPRSSITPSRQPTALASAPTPVPSVPPHGFPSQQPSPMPSATLQSCSAFHAVMTNGNEDNYQTCGVYACAGATFTVSNCASTFAGALCTGDTMLSLTDADEKYLTGNDNGPGRCGKCSQFTYTATGPCQTYVIRQGCKGDSLCTGLTMVADAYNDVRVQTFSPTLYTTRRPSATPSVSPTLPPTFGPSVAPTYSKGFPTPMPSSNPTNPTAAPSVAPTPPPINPTPAPTFALLCPQYVASNTQNALINTASCAIEASSGAILTMGGCNSEGQPMGSCVGDTFLRLYDSSLGLITSNDDGPQGCGQCASITYTFTQARQVYYLVEGCADQTKCGGVSAIIGSGTFNLFVGNPTQLPTLTPTSRLPPIYPPMSPTPQPTLKPTFLPGAAVQTCDLFQSDGTNTDNYRYGTCGVFLCAGTTITLSTCPTVPGASCTGDTYLKLLSAGDEEVAANGDGPPGCGSCSQITFTATLPCQLYTIAEGCQSEQSCTGTVAFVGTAGTFQIATYTPTLEPSAVPPSFAPSSAPTYLPNKPTPLPTIAPTMPTMRPTSRPSNPTNPPTAPPTMPAFCPPFSVSDTNNALDGAYATCAVTACPGDTLTMGNCDLSGQYPGRGCRGDQFFRLYGSDGSPLASSDDACGFCSQIVYKVPSDLGSCQTFVLREGCSAMGSCSGVVSVSGGTILPINPSRVPSPSPSAVPTSLVPGMPNPPPSSAEPTPTVFPTFSPLSCPPYAAFGTSDDKTSFMTCGIYACGGNTFTVSTCPNVPGALCTGDTYLQLWDSSNIMVAFNDDGPADQGCGLCAQITFSTTGPCQTYVLRQGCSQNGACTGTSQVSAITRNQAALRIVAYSPTLRPTENTSPTFMPSPSPSFSPSFGPSLSPTYLPGAPTPLPTLTPTRPTELPTAQPSNPTSPPTASPTFTFFCPPYSVANTNNAYANYAICSFYACPGAVITVGNCLDATTPTKGTFGDTFLRLYDSSGHELDHNDDACGHGSSITYKTTQPCQIYGLHEGCFSDGSCGSTVTFAAAAANGIKLATMFPSTLPTIMPTVAYIKGSPMLAPALLTPAPTLPLTSVICSFFQDKSAMPSRNSPTCRFYACPGTQIKISTCPNSGANGLAGGSCSGKVYLKLYDNNDHLVNAPPSASCNGCPEITYATPSSTQCMIYVVKAGCNSPLGKCSAEVVLTGPTGSFTLDTASPSAVPSLGPSQAPVNFPTPLPTTVTTANPTMMDGVPTSPPTMIPNATPTPAPSGPTRPPVFPLNACPRYDVANTSSATVRTQLCTFTACSGDKVVVGSCSKDGLGDQGIACSGDQLLRLQDAAGRQVDKNDDYCGMCSQINYVVPNGTACQIYTIVEGCYGDSQCNAIVGVQGLPLAYIPNTPTLSPSVPPVPLPTAAPSTHPTPAPSSHFPTPVPSVVPSMEPTPAPSSHPSEVPTPHPTTSIPSAMPTALPTTGPGEPSAEPTVAPSFIPTIFPTPHPSSDPSSHPTPDPTSLPTVMPTHVPSPVPTPDPSVAPTPVSSPAPTPEATLSPTDTGMPTLVVSPVATEAIFHDDDHLHHHESICPDFYVDNHGPVECFFYSCAHNPIFLSTCASSGSGALSVGDTNLELYDSHNQLVSTALYIPYTDIHGVLSTCAEIYFTTPDQVTGATGSAFKTCQTYRLVQGCQSHDTCAGQVAIFAYVDSVVAVTPTPTTRPTVTPTIVKTPRPTIRPSSKPTPWPSSKPTPLPTSRPTTVRTNSPSVRPSALPTRVPTPSTTLRPTHRPSKAGDTIEPTLTSKPTAKPTLGVPTRRPSSSRPTKTIAPTLDFSGADIFSFTPATGSSGISPNPIWSNSKIAGGSGWGSALAISGASLLIVGASEDGTTTAGSRGSVSTFSCSPTGCNFLSSITGSTSSSEFGWGVEAAGNVVAISSPGIVTVNIYDAADLSQAGSPPPTIATVVGPNSNIVTSSYGQAVALWAVPGWAGLSGTQHAGMILAVSDDMVKNPGKSGGSGRVYIYSSASDAAKPWSLSQTLSSPTVGQSFFGDQLAFSSQGILAVGVGGMGAVYLYDCDQDSLMCFPMNQGLVVPPIKGASVINTNGKVEYAVGLNKDTLLIGRPSSNDDVGAVFIYGLTKDLVSVTPTATPTVPPSRLGLSPASAPTYSPTNHHDGYTFVYVRTLTPDAKDSNSNSSAWFGANLDLNDNNLVVIGAAGAYNGMGTTYLYHCTAPGECDGKGDGHAYFEKLDCASVDCMQGADDSSSIALSESGYVLAKGNVAARRVGTPSSMAPGNVQIWLATGGSGGIPYSFPPSPAPTEMPSPEPSPMPSAMPVAPTKRDAQTMFNCSFTVLQTLTGPSLNIAAVKADLVNIKHVFALTVAEAWGYVNNDPSQGLLIPRVVVNNIKQTDTPKTRKLAELTSVERQRAADVLSSLSLPEHDMLVAERTRRLAGSNVPLFSVLVNYTVTFDYVLLGFQDQGYQFAYDTFVLPTLRHDIEGYTAVMPTDDPDASRFTQEMRLNAPPMSALKSAYSQPMIPDPTFVALTSSPTEVPTTSPTPDPTPTSTDSPTTEATLAPVALEAASLNDDKTTKSKSKANIPLIAGATVGAFFIALVVLWYFRHVSQTQDQGQGQGQGRKNGNDHYADDESIDQQHVNPIYRNQPNSRVEFGGEEGNYNDLQQRQSFTGGNFAPPRRASGWTPPQPQASLPAHYQQQRASFSEQDNNRNVVQMPDSGFDNDFASSNPAFNIVKPASSLQAGHSPMHRASTAQRSSMTQRESLSNRGSISRLVPTSPTVQLPQAPTPMARPSLTAPPRSPSFSVPGPVPGAHLLSSPPTAPVSPQQRLPPGQLSLPQNLPTGVLQSASNPARLPPPGAVRPFSPPSKGGAGAAGRFHDDL